MPNTFAYVALVSWPLIAVYIFSTRKIETAIIWSVVGSYLFLPSNISIDLTGLPPLDKTSIASLTLLVILIFKTRNRFHILPKHRVGKTLIILMIIGGFFTVMTNQDTFWIGGKQLQGLTYYDMLGHLWDRMLTIVPFLVGFQYLATVQAHREILKIVLVAGLAYSLLMLFEVRMSPQLHSLVYGYFPSDWVQQKRFGGFRPVVFLSHGLSVAFFALVITVAAAALWRDVKPARAGSGMTSYAEKKRKSLYLYGTGYLGTVLVLCKSLGSLMYGMASIPVIMLTKPYTQIRIAVVLTLISLTYPILRSADLVPLNTALEYASLIDSGRAQSLQTRFENEERLLSRAQERPLFGWGTWGRNRIYDEQSGTDISITDGLWVITLGSFGLIGYISTFGLFALGPLAVWRAMRKADSASLTPVTSALCLLIGISMFDFLLNSGDIPLLWLISGALLGYAVQQDHAPSASMGVSDLAQLVLTK